MDISCVFRWNKARLIRGLVSLFHTYWFCPPTISISLASRCLHGRWSPIIDWICQSEGYGYHQLGGKRSFWHVWWLPEVLYKHQSSQSKRGLRSQVFTLDVLLYRLLGSEYWRRTTDRFKSLFVLTIFVKNEERVFAQEVTRLLQQREAYYITSSPSPLL